MKKEIIKDGNSHKIRLNAENMRIENLKEGEIVDIKINKIKELEDE